MRRDIEKLAVAAGFCAALLLTGCTDGSEGTVMGPDPAEPIPGAVQGDDEADDRPDASERKRKGEDEDIGLRI